VRGTVWAVANQLGVVAGTPAELLSALLAGPPRPVRLGGAGHDPDEVAELADVLREFGHVRVVVEAPDEDTPVSKPGDDGPVDVADAEAVCAADPVRVTAAYEAADDEHGGLRSAWLRAGQSLIRDQDPARRALVIRTALPPDADPRVRQALARSAAAAPWHMEWAGACPVAALTVLPGGAPVVADPGGGVRVLPDGGREQSTATRVRAAAASGEDTVLLLDERGRLHRHGGTGTALTKAVAATLARHPGTALAAAADVVLVGDRMGSVHAFGSDGLHQAALHSGRVTALAATASPSLTVRTGGTDGAVRAWSPADGGHGSTVSQRSSPVVALHTGPTPQGPALAAAWADGLVELHRPGRRDVLGFRPGPAVRAVAVTPDGALWVGTEETLIRLRPR
jgi:hypothetical protein